LKVICNECKQKMEGSLLEHWRKEHPVEYINLRGLDAKPDSPKSAYRRHGRIYTVND
jgi:hypothetical protein